MVLLDVVYNHFGPDGNYLHAYCAAVLQSDGTRRRGARRSTSTARTARRCATSSSTTRSTGSRSSTSTACASTRCTRSATTRTPHFVDELAQRACAQGRAASATCTWCWRTTPTRPRGWRATRTARRAAPPRSGTTTCTTRCMCWLTGETDGYYADYAERPAAAAGARAGRGLRLPGRAVAASRRRRARRAERAPAAAGLRQLPAEPRPGRQPRVRRAHRRAGADAGARCARCTPALLLAPHVADAVHGRGVRGAARRSSTSATSRRAGRGGHRGPARRVRALRRVSPTPQARARIPDPNAAATFEAQQARLGRARAAAALRSWLALDRAAARRCASAHLVPLLAGAAAARGTREVDGDAAARAMAARRRRDAGTCWRNFGDSRPAVRRRCAATPLYGTARPAAGGDMAAPWRVACSIDAAA